MGTRGIRLHPTPAGFPCPWGRSNNGFETSELPTNPGKPVFTSVAPEVSKGRFHERSAAPRGVLSRFTPDAELNTRRTQAEKTLEALRQQMRQMPGQQAGGIFTNFARLKTEKRVMDAEARRRGLG